MALSFATPQRALVRAVADTYADCLRTKQGPPIDVAIARRQHAGYVKTLRDLCVPVDVLPADPDCPDCCFIEDTAVILDRNVVLTCPGAPTRRPEVPPVAEVLAKDRSTFQMTEPATLDGGDALRAGQWMFVGLSTRTNEAGIELLAQVAGLDGIRVVPIEVRGGLHLKSACSLAAPNMLVYDPDLIGEATLDAFHAAGLGCVEAMEPAGANVLTVGAAVLVSSAAPRTAARLTTAGLNVRSVDVREFHKGDGALTCLSLRVPVAGAWAT